MLPVEKSMLPVDKLLPPKGVYVSRVLLELRFQRQERKSIRLEELKEHKSSAVSTIAVIPFNWEFIPYLLHF